MNNMKVTIQNYDETITRISSLQCVEACSNE